MPRGRKRKEPDSGFEIINFTPQDHVSHPPRTTLPPRISKLSDQRHITPQDHISHPPRTALPPAVPNHPPKQHDPNHSTIDFPNPEPQTAHVTTPGFRQYKDKPSTDDGWNHNRLTSQVVAPPTPRKNVKRARDGSIQLTQEPACKQARTSTLEGDATDAWVYAETLISNYERRKDATARWRRKPTKHQIYQAMLR